MTGQRPHRLRLGLLLLSLLRATSAADISPSAIFSAIPSLSPIPSAISSLSAIPSTITSAIPSLSPITMASPVIPSPSASRSSLSPSPSPSPGATIVLRGMNTITSPTDFTQPVILAPNSMLVIQQPVTFAGLLTVRAGSILNIQAAVTVTAPATLTNVRIAIRRGVALTVRGTQMVLRGAVATGRGGFVVRRSGSTSTTRQIGGGTATNTSVTVRNSVLNVTVKQIGQPMRTQRRIDFGLYVTTHYCGVRMGALLLDASSATEFRLRCSVRRTAYSNVVNSLTFSPGAIVAFNNATASTRPTLIRSLADPGNTAFTVVSAGAGAFRSTVLVFGLAARGACPIVFPQAFVSGCPSGYSCSLEGGVGRPGKSPSPNNLCHVVLVQSAQSPSSGNGSGGNPALYGLIALVALVPLAIGVVIWLRMRARRDRRPPARYVSRVPPPPLVSELPPQSQPQELPPPPQRKFEPQQPPAQPQSKPRPPPPSPVLHPRSGSPLSPTSPLSPHPQMA